MAILLNLGWLGQNAVRAYPLRETGSRSDISGSFVLPDSLILDASVMVPSGAGVDYSAFQITGVTSYSAGVTITLGYLTSTLGVVSVPATHAPGDTYTISCASPLTTAVASITIGDLTEVQENPGAWTFDGTANLEPVTIRPALSGVNALLVTNAAGTVSTLTGEIELTAGSNTQFVVSATSTGYELRIDAISDTDLGRSCECGGAASAGVPITSICSVGPDANGNIDLVPVSSCISMSSGGTGKVNVDDTCSSTCCDSSDLKNVVSDVNLFGTQLLTLTNLASKLELGVERLLT